MEGIVLFVHRHGVSAPIEIDIAATATGADLLAHPALNSILIGINVEAPDLCVFIEEEATPLPRHLPIGESGARHGSRVHLSHHSEVEVEMYFMHRVAHHRFPPGTRVRRVKDWATQHFGMAGNDAIEHVLNLHGSAETPSPGTPLSALMHGHHCKLAFDLVPAKRVEG